MLRCHADHAAVLREFSSFAHWCGSVCDSDKSGRRRAWRAAQAGAVTVNQQGDYR